MTALTMFLIAGCGGDGAMRVPPNGPTPTPTPSPTPMTANAYVLPGAAAGGGFAFGDEPVVVYRGERLRWVNADTLAHVIVADSPDATDFRRTELPPGGGESFVMNRLGTTTIHCAIHPSMTGTLTVREH